MDATRMKSFTPEFGGTVLTLNLRIKQVRHFWYFQASILFTFIFYTAFLYYLPNVWDNTSHSPSNSGSLPLNDITWNDADNSSVFAKIIAEGVASRARSLAALDVWFALGLSTALDAITTVGTFNRPVIDNWHYFISVRMMALASLISFAVFLSGSRTACHYAAQYSILAITTPCAAYMLVGVALNAFHKPPSTKKCDLRYWSLKEYTTALARHPGPWRSALVSTAMTGGLGTVLTVLVPRNWSTIIPVITTGFEAVYLRLNGYGRSPQYTVCAAPIFQAGVCVHWGLRQVVASPRLFLPSWAFVALAIAGRCILDLHMATIYGVYPEFKWARKHALVSTKLLVLAGVSLLLLEQLGVPIIVWIKPFYVVVMYFSSSSGVSAPAAYIIAFGKGERSQVASSVAGAELQPETVQSGRTWDLMAAAIHRAPVHGQVQHVIKHD